MVPADVLTFPTDDDLQMPLDPEPTVATTAEPEFEIEPDPPSTEPAPAALVSSALVEILPADFPLPVLIKFIPNTALKVAAVDAAAYALGVAVEGPEGLKCADVALTALRTSLKAIDEHFDEPVKIANDLHKRLTGIRGEWQADGLAAVKTVGGRIFTEQRRLEAIAAEQRRKDQAEADRQARETAKLEAEAAAKAQAPAAVVEELKRQAETVTAPPVAVASPAPTLKGSSTVVTWKARLIGTPGADEPNPETAQLTPPQRQHVMDLLRAILDGKAPLAAVELNWSYLNSRAKADKGTLAIAGIEAFEQGSVRSKGTRSR